MALSNLVYIDETGYHYPDYPNVLKWYQEQYKSIFGADVYLGADSQDGQLLTLFATASYDVMSLGSTLFNSFSPQFSQGIQLSKNVKINGITRLEATLSTVDLKIIGTSGTVITNGKVEDVAGDKWLLPVTVTIPSSGEITVTAVSEFEGAYAVGANAITKISTPTLGWQTVANLTASVSGRDYETDAELRIRQKKSTAQPSQTVYSGIIGGIMNIDGVDKAELYENDTDLTDENGLPPHTISAVVRGGDSQTVGEVIALRKTIGCGTFGTTSVVVADSIGIPKTINFNRPITATIKINIAIKTLFGWSQSYTSDIQNAIIAHIDALSIGEDIIFVKLYVPANLAGTLAFESFDIASMTIVKNTGAFISANIPILFNEIASITATDINVTLI